VLLTKVYWIKRNVKGNFAINPNLALVGACGAAYPVIPLAKDAKLAKEEKKGFCMLSMLVNYTQRSLTKPFSSLFLLFLCGLGVPLRPLREK